MGHVSQRMCTSINGKLNQKQNIGFHVEFNTKNRTFYVRTHLQISLCKNVFSKGYT